MPDNIAASLQLPQELTYRQARECLMRLRPLVQGAVGQRVGVGRGQGLHPHRIRKPGAILRG